MAEKLELLPDYLAFEDRGFWYHLPSRLKTFRLGAHKEGKITSLTQKIKWRLSLKSFILDSFIIDSDTLKMLNFKDSKLEKIEIRGGDMKRQYTDQLPVAVKKLILENMGIQELVGPFDNLENLQELSLAYNHLTKVNPIKLSVFSLNTLNVSGCDLCLISPCLVSMLYDENKNIKLGVIASGNWDMSVIDVRKILKVIKGLTIKVSQLDETLMDISKRYSRLECRFGTKSDSEKSESSEMEEVIPDYDSEDLYNRSESDLDEDDNGSSNKIIKKW